MFEINHSDRKIETCIKRKSEANQALEAISVIKKMLMDDLQRIRRNAKDQPLG